MLSKVELRNFRGFDKLALDLEPVSVVVGPNSSGKTTVLHAISVALRAYSIALDDAAARPVAKGSQVTICSGLILREHTELLPIAEHNELFCNGTVFEGATATITLTFDGPRPLEQALSLDGRCQARLQGRTLASRRLLFHEGPSDAIVLCALLDNPVS